MRKKGHRMVDLSLIMPAKNEGRFILNSIKEVEKVFDNQNFNYELVVIDDGSTDNTYEEAMKAAKKNEAVKVVRKKNGGKGSALKCGFEHCSGRLITFIDADLDLHPKQIPLFIDYMKKYDADVVIGSKRHPLSKINYPTVRKVLSHGYQILTTFLFDLNLTDTQAGLKLFKYEVLDDILPRVLCKKYAFDLELLVSAHNSGFKIVEAPIELNWQRVEGRLTPRDIGRIALDTAAIFYRLKILKYYDKER
jgi:glycosyltransferase involved in cell wall biosynthesis